MDAKSCSINPNPSWGVPTQPSIQLTTYDNLSVAYRILRTLIRPLRPRLVSPGKPLPAGSPKLSPPATKCTIRERQVAGIYLYKFIANSTQPVSAEMRKGSASHHIFYFAGGGFQSPPSSEHWKFCTEICTQLRDLYEITLVSYPLAPNSPASESLPALRNWLRFTVSEAALKGTNMTLMGDSAGGNIALSLGFWWASNVSNHNARSSIKSIFVISPVTNLRNENQSITEANKHDPVLTVKLTSDVGKQWASNMPLDHADVSPIFSDPSLFKKADIRVHGVVGTHDVLAPDAIKFREACNQSGVVGEWLEWKGQMHCFPLAFPYALPEGKRGKEWVLAVLRRNA